MAEVAAPSDPQGGLLRHVGYVLRSNPVTLIAFVMFAFFVGCAVFGPMLVPYDPLASNAARALQPPSVDHWFGTDAVGRDVFSRVIVPTRSATAISAILESGTCT